MNYVLIVALAIAVAFFAVIRKAKVEDQPVPDVEVFPSIESVFAADLDKCREVLFPMCTINLGSINPEWKGKKVHGILYNEDPYNVETVPYFNEYCKDNMIAFDVAEGKYTFKTDFRYFDLTEDWKQWFDETKESYTKSKERYEAKGIGGDKDYYKLGGKPAWWQSDETPLDPDGLPMEFITEFGFNEKMFFLFYSHKHKLAVQIYQIT